MDYTANDHHLVLGELTDFLSGKTIPDTLDERYRQALAKRLVNENGFKKEHLRAGISHQLTAQGRTAVIKIDYLVLYKEKIVALIKYAPGSLVTRRLSTLALSRTIVPYQIPIIVVTNGEDAEIIDGNSGKVTDQGMSYLPTLISVQDRFDAFLFKEITAAVFDQASKIAFACEVDGACPCDTDICILDQA